MLAEVAQADLYEIKPSTPYSSADLNWTDRKSRSSVEMNDRTFRPALADMDADIAGHDVIFLGFPIWWSAAPTIINTFLEAYDFSGRTIILFATSGGSGFGKAVEGLRGSVAKDTVIREGKLLNGQLRKYELSAWLESLGL